MIISPQPVTFLKDILLISEDLCLKPCNFQKTAIEKIVFNPCHDVGRLDLQYFRK